MAVGTNLAKGVVDFTLSALRRMASEASEGKSILAPNSTSLSEVIELPQSPGIRTFVSRYGANVSESGEIPKLDYLRSVARSAGVPESEVSKITDEIDAWEITSRNTSSWGASTAPENIYEESLSYSRALNPQDISVQNGESFRALVDALNQNTPIESIVASRMAGSTKGVFGKAKKIIESARKNEGSVGINPDPSFTKAGFKGVRWAKSPEDVVTLIRAGEISKAREAYDDMVFNQMVSLPPSIRNQYLLNQDSPVFYLLSDMRNRWISAKSGIPLNVVASLGGVGSANRGPAPETIRVLRGIAGIDYNPEAGKFFVSDELSVARSGKKVKDANNAERMANALNDLIDGTVGGMSRPSRSKRIHGLAQKANDYDIQQGQPLSARSTVQDLWQARAPFGNPRIRNKEGKLTRLDTPENIEENIVLQAVGASAARQSGISSLPAAQEMSWKQLHYLGEGKISNSFYSVDDPQVKYFQIGSKPTNKTIQDLEDKVAAGTATESQINLLQRYREELKDGVFQSTIVRKNNPTIPDKEADDILAASSAMAGSPTALRLQEGLAESMGENLPDWVSVAGTPMPSARYSFMGAPKGVDEPYDVFNTWLGGYADESRSRSRLERLSRLVSELPESERPSSFRYATGYRGFTTPEFAALAALIGAGGLGAGYAGMGQEPAPAPGPYRPNMRALSQMGGM